jgi:hypothetical protein
LFKNLWIWEVREAAEEGGLFLYRTERLPSRPGVALPITTTFMLADRDIGTRAPGILVDHYARCGWIVVMLFDVPAYVAVANNGGRCADRREGQDSSAGNGTQKNFPQHCHDDSSFIWWLHRQH